MNPSINAIMVTGKYGAGKSTVRNFLARQLTEDFSWLEVISESDRAHIDAMVIRDVGGRKSGLEGEHSTLIAVHLSGDLEWAVKSGVLHEQAHVTMFKTIAEDTTPQRLRIVEIANGPNVPLEKGRQPLLQSGDYLLSIIAGQLAIADRVLVLEAEAPYDVRLRRNVRRLDPIPEHIFQTCAADEGEIWKLHHRLPHYIRFDNGYDDENRFSTALMQVFDERISPLLTGEVPKDSEGRVGLHPERL